MCRPCSKPASTVALMQKSVMMPQTITSFSPFSGLAPLSYEEAYSMIHSLRAYKIIQGTRGQKGVNEDKFAEIIVRLSTLLRFATEIKEMDINPLLATEKAVVAVDARIRIEK